MGITIGDMCSRWAKGIESGEGNGYKQYKSCNVWYNGRTIYSYGSHFPMAYIIAPNLVWLNGDRFSNSTNRHQRELRDAISRTDATVVIVPNSALQAAGASYETIQPVDVHGERWEYISHTAMQPPSSMQTDLTEHVAESTYRTNYYRCDACDKCQRYSYANHHEVEQVTVTPAHDVPMPMGYGTSGHKYSNTNAETWPYVVGWIAAEDGKQAVRHDPVTGEYRWHTARHWLGDSVFTAIRHASRWQDDSGERVYFISSFDRQERNPLYFLSQLPHAVDTVDAAIESLAPESVKTARDMGREVVRQGDMFAIPMQTTRRELKKLGATFEKRKVTIRPNHYAAAEIAKRDAVNALLPDMPAYPERKYISDFPGNGSLYDREAFDVWYKSWQDACDSWADDLVARYEAAYPDLEPITRWSWQSASKFKPSSWHMTRESDGTALYGTAHTASEVATLPDGRQLARGIMYHDPAVIGQTRAADHRRQRLGDGKTWHLVARNTVPVQGTGSGRRAA